jgi:hypothetical protein
MASTAPMLTADQFTAVESLPNIARSEFYISQGLSFLFDRDHENLAPWNMKFKSLRASASWQEAGYNMHKDKCYNILFNFTKIKEYVFKGKTSSCWMSKKQAKSLKPDFP